MAGRVNKSPLCAREGKIYIDGTLVADSCKFQYKPSLDRLRHHRHSGTVENHEYVEEKSSGIHQNWCYTGA